MVIKIISINSFPCSNMKVFVYFVYLLSLQAVEVEFLLTWHNPLCRLDLQLPGETTITAWRSKSTSDNSLKEITRLAWSISPSLAVFLPERFLLLSFLLVSLLLLLTNYLTALFYTTIYIFYIDLTVRTLI